MSNNKKAANSFDFENMFQGIMGLQTSKAEWWHSYHYPETVEFNPSKLIGCARSALYAKVVASKGVVYESERYKCSTNVHSVNPLFDNIEEMSKAFDARLVYKLDSTELSVLFYIFNSGALCVTYHKRKLSEKLFLCCVSIDEKNINIFNNHFSSCYKMQKLK